VPLNEAKPRRAFWNSFLKKRPVQAQFNLETSMEKV
jgi:hypothetical protein